jgi:hypothetical protein
MSGGRWEQSYGDHRARASKIRDPRVSRWLAERCVERRGLETGTESLAASWRRWCLAHGVDPGGPNHLAEQLELRGYDSYLRPDRTKWITDLVCD